MNMCYHIDTEKQYTITFFIVLVIKILLLPRSTCSKPDGIVASGDMTTLGDTVKYHSNSSTLFHGAAERDT